MHRQDFWEPVRRHVTAALGKLVVALKSCGIDGLYATKLTDRREFVGVVRHGEERFERILHEMGFERNPLAAWKRVRGTDAAEEGSFAWRGRYAVEDDGDDGDGGFVGDPFADRQLHVITFELDGDAGTTAVFAHWEYSWVTHPLKHYRGVDVQDRRGARMMREMLQREGIDIYGKDVSDVIGGNSD